MSALWFTPVCDDLLQVITLWLKNYERGEVESDRKWLNLDGVVVDRPTRFAHRLALKPLEAKYLLNIMATLAPKSETTKEIAELHAGLRRGKLLPGGRYMVTIAYWKEQVQEIYDTLVRAKTGQVPVADLVEQQKKDGKSPFEV